MCNTIPTAGAGKGAAAGNGDDDDVEMDASREQSVKCPLTQKLMEDPVRRCGTDCAMASYNHHRRTLRPHSRHRLRQSDTLDPSRS